MAVFSDLEVTGLLQASQIQGAVSAEGLTLTPSETAPVAIDGTANNYVLPGLGGPQQQPMTWTITGTSEPTINGISVGNGVKAGQIIYLINGNASTSIALAALASGSLAGNQIAAAATIDAGQAQGLIYNGTNWSPIA
jgi:hypothetical protein